MSAALLTNNLLAWSGQILALVAVGALASMTLSHSRARLVFWQGLLALCLLLPILERWTPPPRDSPSSVSVALGPSSVVYPATAARTHLWKREDLLLLIAAGVVFRFLWMAIGFLRLRRHRRQARLLAAPPGPIELSNIRWYVSETIAGPVTFGWLRPCVLLPAEVMEMPARLLNAVACHELRHVQRRDWLQVMAEETIRALFWFHPAIWFALSELQLAREQVVDGEVVRITSDREGYLDALVTVAARRLEPDVMPAPLFLKKRHLATRVAAVLKEVPMSKSKLYSCLATVASAALITARVAVWLFPLHSPAQTISAAGVPPDAQGIVVNAGGNLLHRPALQRPGANSSTGIVTLELAVNGIGEVTDAQALSGPADLRSLAIENALRWQYATDPPPPPAIKASITFGPGVAGAARTLANIQFAGVPPVLEQNVRAQLAVREGGQFSADEMHQAILNSQAVDQHLSARLGSTVADGQVEWTLTIALPDAAPETSVSNASDSPRIRVGGNVQAANLISKLTPRYPVDAKAARQQGKVRFSALIGTDGAVKNLDLVSGTDLVSPPSSLIDAASGAVKQWVYQPTILNGQPVEVMTQIDVNFTLVK